MARAENIERNTFLCRSDVGIMYVCMYVCCTCNAPCVTRVTSSESEVRGEVQQTTYRRRVGIETFLIEI